MSQLVIETKPRAALPEEGATAVIYLRVSSAGQLTGHSQDGYSDRGAEGGMRTPCRAA